VYMKEAQERLTDKEESSEVFVDIVNKVLEY
jgi:hypothetical protein